MLAMYRGQSQDTTPSLFSARDEGYPAEDLPRMGGPPKEAAFRLRFGLALLASLVLHVLLILLVPSLPYSAAAPSRADPERLTVSLKSLAAAPSQPAPSTDQPQSDVQESVQPVPTEPQTPVVQTEPQPDQVPVQQREPVPASIVPDPSIAPTTALTPAEPATTSAAAPVSQSSREQVLDSGAQAPKAALVDAARIGEEFKLAFMQLLAYPEAARRRGVQGTVGLRLVMESDGRIAEALVSQTSGSSILDRAAVNAALATPGPREGPGRRLELSLRVSFEAGRVTARP